MKKAEMPANQHNKGGWSGIDLSVDVIGNQGNQRSHKALQIKVKERRPFLKTDLKKVDSLADLRKAVAKHEVNIRSFKKEINKNLA